MQKNILEPSLLSRVTQAARYVMQGVAPDSWFGPMQPLQPLAPPDVTGRRFDYPTGYNLLSTPRSYEGVTFEDLRALADNCDILRSVIESRKDQMEALDWGVRARVGGNGQIASPTNDQAQRVEQIKEFLHCPDKEHGFDQWLRQILEDMFVIDGVALYKRRNRAGGLYALEILDGATIKILMDDHGRLPQPPDPAYQQILKGVPASDYTREELWYLQHNPRSHKVYGYSHVEQVMVTINILIRRSMHQLEYYREGSQPDAFVGLPKEWNQDQIIAFQKHFDAMLAGNLAMRHRLRFMPGDFTYQETKAPPLKDAYDEFLARIICYVFSISPEPFVGQMNRATAESSQSRAIDEGLAPLMRFVRGLMNRIIAVDFNSPDLEFFWQDVREQDPAEAAEIDVAYVNAGIKTVDEVRSTLGLGALANVTDSVKKNLKKDDSVDDDEEDEDEDESEDEEEESSGSGSSSGGHYNPDEARIPAGQPGGGQWTTGGTVAAETVPDSGSTPTDKVRSDVSGGGSAPDTSNFSINDISNTIVDGMNNSSTLQQGTQLAGDGDIFENREKLLPDQPIGYYTISVVPTSGIPGSGPQRIINGQGGEAYYTPDHYKTFYKIK